MDDLRVIEDLEEMMKPDFYLHTVKRMREPLKGAEYKYLHIDIQNGEYTIGISEYIHTFGPYPVGDLTQLRFWMRMLRVQNEFSKTIQ
jgi:hypothetical protein